MYLIIVQWRHRSVAVRAPAPIMAPFAHQMIRNIDCELNIPHLKLYIIWLIKMPSHCSKTDFLLLITKSLINIFDKYELTKMIIFTLNTVIDAFGMDLMMTKSIAACCSHVFLTTCLWRRRHVSAARATSKKSLSTVCSRDALRCYSLQPPHQSSESNFIVQLFELTISQMFLTNSK